MEMKLLDLTVEYANYDRDVLALEEIGVEPERTKEIIAAEYGAILRKLLSTPE